MLDYLSKKFVHCFVIASIIFGCSVQAATPSFQEDLDDFEELHLIADGNSVAPIIEPLVILWQNEDLSQTVTSAHGIADDFEKYVSQANAALLIDCLKYSHYSDTSSFYPLQFLAFHQARAPPVIL